MINNINKNISVWRGDITPPTEYHVWIKSNGSVLINKDGTWFTLISESTNDSVNVCNLSDVGYLPTLVTAILTVSAYLGTKVFHVGYKLRYNEAPMGYDPIWKEYILTGSNWYRSDNWKLVFTTDLMNNEEIIKSGHLPSYVDDVLEYDSVTKFPIYGESGKIYLDTSTNKSYRWSGTLYVLIALTDIVTSESDGLMSSEMYLKLEKTAVDLDIHDKQNLADFTEIRLSLGQKVGKIVDSQGNIISNEVSISTIPDATSLSAGLMTPDDKIKLDSIESEFVKDLGLVASTDEGDLIAAKSEIAGNVKISFIRYRTVGVRAEKVTTIFLWRNGVNETALIKFVDKALWRRNVTGATGVEGATTTPTMWERTGAHYLGYDAATRTLQLQDYNKTAFRKVLLPLALNDADATIDGLISSEDIASIITNASFNKLTGELLFNNKTNSQVTSLVIPTATQNGKGLMSELDVIAMGSFAKHTSDTNNPHNVTKAQVGLGNVTNDAQVKRSEMGLPDGVALLNSEGKISSSYLPSYVSDVVTANSYSALPATGEEDKIYVTKDTNLTYRWSGTGYVEISPSLALGETSTTAYAGDKGKALAVDVKNLNRRVGNSWVDTETGGFAYIGTGSSRVRIIPGADIFASVVGRDASFTISSNTDTASIGYGASIGLNSVLGAGLSASINNVTGPDGHTRQGIILKDVNDDNGIKILGRDNGEFLVGTSVNDSDWIDLARLGKISNMIGVREHSGLWVDPSVLTGNSNDSEISIGTNTSIGSNVHIGSYAEIGEGIVLKNDSTGYILLGDGTTKIKKGVTIDGNSGSSELRVHEYLGSWLIGEDLTPTETNAMLGKGIVIVGTNATNQPMLIKAGGATALIGNNFNAYSGVTLGSYSSLGNLAKLGDNVEIILGASGLTIVSNDYGITIGTKVSIGNNVSLGNNSWLGLGSYLASGSHMGENSAVQGNALISTGVHIDESLTSDDVYYRLGETSTASIIMKNCAIEANIMHNSGGNLIQIEDTNRTKYLYTGSGNTFGENNTIGDNVLLGSDVEIGEGISLKDDSKAGLPILILTTASGSTVQMGNGFKAYPGATLGTGANIGADVNIGANVSMGYRASIGLQVDISDYVAVGTSVKGSSSENSVEIGADITIATGINITKNTATTTILNNNTSSKQGGKLTFGTDNIIWDGVEIGTGVKITEDLTSDSTSYKLGETNLATIGKNAKLGASLGITDNGYTLDDPSMNISMSTIGKATVIYSEVTIGTGIQIQDSSAGGLQIYSPSLKRWITIS